MIPVLIQLKALSDSSRLRIVMALNLVDELCACQIVGLLQVSGPTASRHLAILERAGLLKRRRDGRWIWFRLESESDAAGLMDWIRERAAREPRIAADRKTLEDILALNPAEYCRLQHGRASCSTTGRRP